MWFRVQLAVVPLLATTGSALVGEMASGDLSIVGRLVSIEYVGWKWSYRAQLQTVGRGHRSGRRDYGKHAMERGNKQQVKKAVWGVRYSRD